MVLGGMRGGEQRGGVGGGEGWRDGVQRSFTAPPGGAARLIEAAGWDEERTQQFLTLMVEFNHGIEELEGRARDHV
ncbi:hypothetical protein [Streptomyces tendae]|uniref:hypothetical protein n=1 Tax=Streptomyces tendae TaxID=1932 RepID=UPI0037A877C2